jgi:hypothetical protein
LCQIRATRCESENIVARQIGEVARASGSRRWSSGVTSAVAGKNLNFDLVSKEQPIDVSMIVI